MRHVGFEGQTIFKAIDNQCQVLFIILKNFTVTSVVAAQSNCVLSWAHISVWQFGRAFSIFLNSFDWSLASGWNLQAVTQSVSPIWIHRCVFVSSVRGSHVDKSVDLFMHRVLYASTAVTFNSIPYYYNFFNINFLAMGSHLRSPVSEFLQCAGKWVLLVNRKSRRKSWERTRFCGGATLHALSITWIYTTTPRAT